MNKTEDYRKKFWIRSNYIKKEDKWIRVMEYWDLINNEWREFNDFDWYNLDKFLKAYKDGLE